MERLLIKEISNHEGEKITIKGRIFNIRNLGSISFLIIRDYSGVVQVIEKLFNIKIKQPLALLV
jgi:aspartyl/asparaginyl-tRNA synthetase